MTTPISRASAPSLAFERFRWLPLRPNVWQLGFVRLPTWTDEKMGRPYRALRAICRSAAGGTIGSSEPFWPGAPVGAPALEAAANLAAQNGMAYRPRQIEVTDAHLADAIRDRLEDLGIELVLVSRLDELDDAAVTIRRRFGGLAASTWHFDPSVGVGALRAFANAAAEFCRAALWNHVGEQDVIQVVHPAAPQGLSHFQVMRSAEQPKGLLFFESAEARRRLMKQEEAAPFRAGLSLWSLLFADIMRLPLADSELWEAHELPFAGPEGYPVLQRQRVQANGTASAEHFAFVEALCRALAVTTEDDLDEGRWSRTVTTRQGACKVELLLPATAELNAASSADSRVDRAADLIERAIECRGRARLKLAREALRQWPDCSSGYLLQADSMPDLERRAALCRLAYETSERVLGPEQLAEDARLAWGTPEARRYFHSRRELAECCWQLGDTEQALQHWNELLRMDPRDVRRVRDIMVPRLLAAYEDEEAALMLLDFENDPSSILAYARALHAFAESGESPEASRLLRTALARNIHAVEHLAARRELTGPIPEGLPVGSDAEARFIAHLLHSAWHHTSGAIEWLLKEGRPSKARRRKA